MTSEEKVVASENVTDLFDAVKSDSGEDLAQITSLTEMVAE